MIIEFIESKFFLENIFLVKENLFKPPDGYDFKTIKSLFYESLSKLHNLNIIHNDLIFINSFKYNIHNCYLDTITNSIKFIDFGLSYMTDSYEIESEDAKNLELSYINNFFNEFFENCIEISK